jgi:hypothetical protein
MQQTGSATEGDKIKIDEQRRGRSQGAIAVACGAFGIAAAVWAYWLIVPGLALGAIAVALGAWSRRHGEREVGSVAVALGIVAVLLVPSILFVVSEAEDWGRGCAINPSNPDC